MKSIDSAGVKINKYLAILATAFIVIGTGIAAGNAITTVSKNVSSITNPISLDKGNSIGDMYTVSEYLNGRIVKYRYRYFTSEDALLLKETLGVRDPHKNYNVIIDGHGTGLAPPTEREYEEMIGTVKIVTGIENYKSRGSVDHSTEPYFPPVGDQGQQGSCAAWAASYYANTYLQARLHGWTDVSSNPHHQMSPAWTYNKVNDGRDGGSYIYDNWKLIHDLGDASLATMPYDDQDYISWGDEDAWREAPVGRVVDFYQVKEYSSDINTIKSWIDEGYLVNFAINASAYNAGFSDGNYIISWQEYEPYSSRTNHAQTIVGYDDSIEDDGDIGAFKVVNSWGTDFGDGGFYWITYNAFSHIGWAFVVKSEIVNNPHLVATWKFSSPGSRDSSITVGIGSPTDPLKIKSFSLDTYGISDYYNNNGYNEIYKFPYFMLMDLSEFEDDFNNGEHRFFLKIGTPPNPTQDYTPSTISSFKIEYYAGDYIPGNPTDVSDESPDVPATSPTTVTNVYPSLHAPSPPQNLQVFKVGDGYINLQWDPPSSDGGSPIEYYYIYRGTQSGGEQYIGYTDASTLFYNDTGLTNGVTYYYYITAYNNIGESSPSNEVYATPQGTPTAPWAPQNLQAIPDDSAIHLMWDPPMYDGGSPIVEYVVYRATESGHEILYRTTTSLHFDDINVTNGQRYYYQVSAVNSVGEGPKSDEISAIPAEGGSIPWGMFNRDRHNSGISPYNTSLVDGTLKWTYTTGDYINEPPIIDSKGNIYFGSTDNKFYSLKPDGNLRWSVTLNGDPTSGALDCYGNIYVGTSGGTLYALSSINGAIEWTYSISGSIYSSPTIANDGTIYFGGTDGYLYALSSNGNLKWRYQSGDAIYGSPAVGDDGTVYFTSYDMYIYALNSDGSLKWRYQTGMSIYGGPLIDRDGNIIVYSDKVYCLYNSGSLRWTFTPDTNGFFTPASDYNTGTIYIGDADGNFYALYPSGILKWKYTAGGQIGTSAAIGDDGTVYFGSYDHKIYALNPDGTLKWSYTTGDVIASGPAIGTNYTVYIGSVDYKLYCFTKHIYTVPSAPRNLVASAGDGVVTLSWDPPVDDGGGVTYYYIYRGTSPGQETYIGWVSGTTTFTNAGVTNSVTYYYYVTAVNPAGESSPSNEVSATPHSTATPPSPPQNLNAQAGDSQIRLTWDAPADNGGAEIEYYKIYRGTSPGNEVYIDEVHSNIFEYTDTGLTNSVTYYYYVTAVNSAGESDPSNEVSATPQQTTYTVTFVVNPSGSGTITFNGCTYLDGQSTMVSSGSYSISANAATGYQFDHWETTGGVSVNDAYSSSTTATVNGDGSLTAVFTQSITPPSPPQNLQATAGDGQVALTWDPPANDGGNAITEYKIYRGTYSGGESYLTSVSASITSYTDTSVTNGVTYYYYVTAVNSAGESQPSNEVNATPHQGATVPSAPRNLQANAGDGYVNLTWDAPVDDGGDSIIEYRIYRNGSLIATVSATQLWYNDTTVINGVTYTYYVTAVNSVGESTPSNEVSATPEGTVPELSTEISVSILIIVSLLGVMIFRKFSLFQ